MNRLFDISKVHENIFLEKIFKILTVKKIFKKNHDRKKMGKKFLEKLKLWKKNENTKNIDSNFKK